MPRHRLNGTGAGPNTGWSAPTNMNATPQPVPTKEEPSTWKVIVWTVVISAVLVTGFFSCAGAVDRQAAEKRKKWNSTTTMPMNECQTAEKVFDLYQAEVADGVVSSIKKVQDQAKRLRLLGCPNWRY